MTIFEVATSEEVSVTEDGAHVVGSFTSTTYSIDPLTGILTDSTDHTGLHRSGKRNVVGELYWLPIHSCPIFHPASGTFDAGVQMNDPPHA